MPELASAFLTGSLQCCLGALSTPAVGFEFVQEFPKRFRSRVHYNSVQMNIYRVKDAKVERRKIVNSRARIAGQIDDPTLKALQGGFIIDSRAGIPG